MTDGLNSRLASATPSTKTSPNTQRKNYQNGKNQNGRKMTDGSIVIQRGHVRSGSGVVLPVNIVETGRKNQNVQFRSGRSLISTESAFR